MSKRGKYTEKLRKVKGNMGAEVSVIGDLVPSHRGKKSKPHETEKAAPFKVADGDMGNSRTGGPTSVIPADKFENYPTKGGH